MPLGDERAGLATPDEAEVLEPVEREVREGVVDHEVVDVGHAQPDSANAAADERRKAFERVKSSIIETSGVSDASPVPST